jgi:tetratricopeptide (TPR) repeat protein
MKKENISIVIALFFFVVPFVQADENIAVIDSLHRLLEKREGKEQVETLLDISEAYRFISFEKTLETGLDAVDKAEEEGLIALKAKILKSMGVSAYFIGDYDLAKQYYTESMAVYETIEDYEGLAACTNNIGLVEQDQGNMDSAIEFFNQSIVFEEKAGNMLGVGLSLRNIATIYYRQGSADQSFEYYYRALLVFNEIGHEAEAAIVSFYMAMIYWQWDDYQKAIEVNTEALGVFIGLDMIDFVAKAYNNLALIYADNLKDYETAIEFHKRAIEIKQQLADIMSLALSHSNLGSAYARNGDYDLALNYLGRAMQVFENNQQAYGISLTHFYFGNLYHDKGDYALSSEHFNKSLHIAEKHDINEFRADIIKGQLQNYAAIGDFPKFMHFFDLFNAEYDSTASKLGESQKSEYRAKRKFDDIVRESNKLLDRQQQMERQLTAYRLSFSAVVALMLGVLLLYYFRKMRA